ncbi:hypothetical protein RND71_010519 [Anisodus tanguticus]|uniref:Uncharacterized protein n=1 Tax=Anisodus tanguticus TaxID=243964 RepID=A0AAE1SJY9_9SOLA|nr:hypothetical protein RND71_010519 [Anisodus tanguticus]
MDKVPVESLFYEQMHASSRAVELASECLRKYLQEKEQSQRELEAEKQKSLDLTEKLEREVRQKEFYKVQSGYNIKESTLAKQVRVHQADLAKKDAKMVKLEIALVTAQNKAKEQEENIALLRAALQAVQDVNKMFEEKYEQAHEKLVKMEAEMVLDRNFHIWRTRKVTLKEARDDNLNYQALNLEQAQEVLPQPTDVGRSSGVGSRLGEPADDREREIDDYESLPSSLVTDTAVPASVPDA